MKDRQQTNRPIPPAPRKVLVLPCSPSNPYIYLLIFNLQVCGVDIRGVMETGLKVLPKMILKKGKPDILHLQWQHPLLLARTKTRTIAKSILFILEILALKLFGVRLVWTVHNIHNHEKQFVNIELFFCRLLAKVASGIIVHSHSAAQEVSDAFRLTNQSKIHVVPHAHYIDYYPNTITKQEARMSLDIPEDKFVLLLLGKLRSYKGIKSLIRMWEQFDCRDSLLILAGKPYSEADKEDIEALVKPLSNVRFYSSYIPDEKVQVFMKAADAAVLPYENILTSGAAILAMSFAKSIITPAHPFMKEVLNPDSNFLYEPEDEDGLLNALNKAYRQRDSLEEKGKRNFQQVKQDGWLQVSKTIKKIYH